MREGIGEAIHNAIDTLAFVPVGFTGHTWRWEVRNISGKLRLGAVAWSINQFSYTFCPVAGISFTDDSLRDISEFCKNRTQERRAIVRKQRENKIEKVANPLPIHFAASV